MLSKGFSAYIGNMALYTDKKRSLLPYPNSTCAVEDKESISSKSIASGLTNLDFVHNVQVLLSFQRYIKVYTVVPVWYRYKPLISGITIYTGLITGLPAWYCSGIPV